VAAAPHSHGLVHDSIKRSRAGVRAVLLALAVLGLTAVAQALVLSLSGSVALLADLVHNVGDALTALPLGIAFVIEDRVGDVITRQRVRRNDVQLLLGAHREGRTGSERGEGSHAWGRHRSGPRSARSTDAAESRTPRCTRRRVRTCTDRKPPPRSGAAGLTRCYPRTASSIMARSSSRQISCHWPDRHAALVLVDRVIGVTAPAPVPILTLR